MRAGQVSQSFSERTKKPPKKDQLCWAPSLKRARHPSPRGTWQSRSGRARVKGRAWPHRLVNGRAQRTRFTYRKQTARADAHPKRASTVRPVADPRPVSPVAIRSSCVFANRVILRLRGPTAAPSRGAGSPADFASCLARRTKISAGSVVS